MADELFDDDAAFRRLGDELIAALIHQYLALLAGGVAAA